MTTLTPDLTVSTSNEKSVNKESIKSLIITGAIMLAVVFTIRAYVATPFIVSGVSMYPTFDSWHYLIIDKLTYNLIREPERGEVVVFHYPNDTKRFFIKRVIGLPGETVSISGETVTINDKLTLREPYILDEKSKKDTLTKTLGSNEYFVLGDNRKESADSRYWGALNREHIVGRPLTRLFPLNKINWLPGEAEYND